MPYLPAAGNRLLCSGAAASLVALCATGALAEEPTRHVQGIFCNTERQIDQTVARIMRGTPPRVAVALANEGAVSCTVVDLLHYVVDRPSLLKSPPGSGSFLKYKGTLVGVVAGGNLRPVTPPVQIFFATQERLAGVSREERA